jgi:hypothetical protein
MSVLICQHASIPRYNPSLLMDQADPPTKNEAIGDRLRL